MAKPITSWLLPSFSQHNLCLVVSGRCLHISVMKFQDKFSSLQQVNSPNSWDKFQKCCTDMIRFLLNLAAFCMFLWISQIYLNSRLRDHTKYRKPWLVRWCICLQWWEHTSRCLSTMANVLCLNDLCGGHYLIQILILLHCRLDRMSKQTTMVHQVFGGYYRSQGKNHRMYFLLASTLMKIDSIRSRIGES